MGHVTRIDQSETTISRFRPWFAYLVDLHNIRALIGQFWITWPSKKKNLQNIFFLI